MRRDSRGRAAALAALGLLLTGADWPGRGRELVGQVETAPPARRVELLTEIAAAGGDAAETAVVRALQDPDVPVRVAAAQLVARYHFRAARDALVAWLADAQADLRAAAVQALGALGDATVAPALIRLLGDAEPRVRLLAIDAVAQVAGSDGTVPLLNRLADGESAVRVATVRVLGGLGDPRAVLSLLGMLQDTMPEVRQATATALGRLRDPRAVRGLLGLLRDPQLDVRLAATRALGTLGAADAVIDLAPLALREDRGADPLARTQLAHAAIDAIGHIGGATARDVLVRAYRRSDDQPELTRAAGDALRALAADEGPRAIIPALTAERIPPRLLDALVDLLGQLGGDEATDALIAIYQSPEGPPITEAILRALGATATPRALEALLRAATAAPGTARPRLPARPVTGDARTPELRRRSGAIAGLRAWAERRGALDTEALDPLVEVLSAVGRDGAADVARLIGLTRNARAPAVLAPLLTSTRPELRAAAAEALAAVGVSGVEPAVAAALTDVSADVRVAAADALGAHGTRAGLDALIAQWDGPRPLDRANAVRAIARMGARLRDPRASRLLVAALAGAGPGLRAAILDGLAYVAAAGDPVAADVILAAVTPTPAAATALEAVGNAVVGARSTAAPALLARLTEVLEHGAEPALRLTAAWELRSGGAAAQAPLVRALGEGSFGLVANASGALARLYASGVAPMPEARAALCLVLNTRRHPNVRANALLAIARGELVCDGERERRFLLEAHSPWVRRAAADAVAVATRAERDPARARVLRGALEECAASDASAEVAAGCRAAVITAGPPATASRAAPGSVSPPGAPPGRDTHDARPRPADDVLDAVIVGDDEQTVAANAPFALRMADGVIRTGVSGPDGWVHERPAPGGGYAVMDPDTQALEP